MSRKLGCIANDRQECHDEVGGEVSPAVRSEPVLIYCPGLRKYPENTADGVAEAVAAALERQRAEAFRAVSLSGQSTPRGLRPGKVVVGPDDSILLHVFELDYRARLEPGSGTTGPAPAPGVLRSSVYLAIGTAGLGRAFLRTIRARRTGSKDGLAMIQLAYGLVILGSLSLSAFVAFVAFVALVAALGAAGAGGVLPARADHLFGTSSSHIAVAMGGVAAGGWVVLRRRLLDLAASTQRNMRYLAGDRHRDTVAMTLGDAVDGLKRNGWTGLVHVLGYSFGSIVAIDALFPPERCASASSDGDREPLSPALGRVRAMVRSLTTIGCPADVIRLYRVNYFNNRSAWADGTEPARWRNVVNAADVFASDFHDGSDGVGNNGSKGPAIFAPARLIVYGQEPLSCRQLLVVKGFRTHSGYWGPPGEASCFDGLAELWIGVDPAPP